MHPISIPQESVFWLIDTHKSHPQLTSNLETDVVIVGGGLTGMTAAQKFHEQGLSVVLLEQYHCGSGASGKSSGFITPNAELGLTHFVKTYGLTKATQIWRFISSGAEQIEHTIRAHNIECGYVQEDSLMVATSKKGFTELTEEYHNFEKIKYQSELYTHQELSTHIGSSKYYGGMRFAATFGINTFAYLQALKEVLQKSGVTIYENTPVINIKSHAVETLNATVKARYIIVCVDRLAPELGIATNKIFQVQTFLMVSRPLEQSTVQTLFPDKRYMVWDTDLVYQYYRLTADNRLLLGGSTPFHSFVYQESCHPHGVYKKLTNYLHAHFPNVNVSFEYMWPGLIGISKDLQPIAGKSSRDPSIYYVSGATGLTWAAALGTYTVQHLLDGRTDFDALFSPDRAFPLGNTVQRILGKRVTFALSNLLALYR